MHSLSVLSEVLTTIGYGVTAVAYLVAYARDDTYATRARGPLLTTTLIVQILFIGSVSADLHHCLVTSGLEVIELLAFIIGLIYYVTERTTKSKASGVLIVPVVFGLQLISSLFRQVSHEVSPLYGSVAMNVHVTTVLFGYAALAMAGAYGGMYLLLYRSIKQSTFGKAFERFPSLGHLEQMSLVAMRIGLVFLAIAIVVGVAGLPHEVSNFTLADPNLIMTSVLWSLYAAGLLARRLWRLEGKRLMEITLYGFVAALVSLTLVNFLIRGFHKFM